MSIPVFLLIAAMTIFLAGLRARSPHPVLQSLILNPDKRGAARWLLFSRGMEAFINPAADATTDYSRRYGERRLTLRTVGWAIGLASLAMTMAVYLGWALFDITTIGGWSFFDKETPTADRALQAAAALLPLFLLTYIAADIEAVQRRFPWFRDGLFSTGFMWSFCLLIWLHMRGFDNNGAIILATGIALFPAPERRLTMILLFALIILAIPVGALGYMAFFNATTAAMVVFMGLVAVMTLLSFTATVEILSALRWYASGGAMILAGYSLALAVGVVLFMATPLMMVFLLYAIMMLTPESVSAPWVNMVGLFRTGGAPAAMMLAIACLPPLLPPVWFLLRGLGNFLARRLPMIGKLVTRLGQITGQMTRDDFNAFVHTHRIAFMAGYAGAAALTLALIAALVWMFVQVYAVQAAS